MADVVGAPGRIVAQGLRAFDVVGTWAEATEREVHADPFQRDPAFLARLLPWMEVLARYFDATVEGLGHVPARGPVLLVGNHSGGILTPDTSVFFTAWYRRFGLERPLVALAFDAAFGVPGFRTLMRKIGEVPANRENARRALRAGHPVLVYPGGDHEVFRPWRDRNRIDFGGRTGFVELALRERVPVVPVVSHGGHDSTIILTRGEWLGRWLGLERIRTPSFPLALQIPWGVSPVGLPAWPLPAKITIRVLPAMKWRSLPRTAADDRSVVTACHREITERMQDALGDLAAAHPYPVLTRLRSLLPSWRASDRRPEPEVS
ncbi:MAG TPA: 1-acyl-sn-glycerol-3-phosphate acyltransferase [Candidatus Binatia bacterium]|nr:1-acyl-sn-glycerol-3-phosphate acyltransferase [Candidatus Binatia bacterium]